MTSERDFQKAVTKLARDHGWAVRHYSDSRKQLASGAIVPDKQAAGVPDLLLIRERVLWAELKTEKGTLRDIQKAIIARLRHAGEDVRLWRPSDWPEIVATLSAPVPVGWFYPGEDAVDAALGPVGAH